MPDRLVPTATLGSIVTGRPAATRVLERFGLDYCCGGRRTLGDACAERGLEASDVIAALEALGDPGPPPDWAAMGPAELVDHIEATHHAYLDEELPRLAGLADKVVGAHGARHPELDAVRATYAALRDELEPHLRKEERILFPMVRELAAADQAPTFPCGTLRNPIAVMLLEHDRAGELLARLREQTSGYAPPADACATYRAFYDGLAELEADTHLHIHKENNVLFPAVLAVQDALAS